ncbi:hypothetical protein [Leifsonia xyli]|uniref:hypothetical protein n=1 Tax=Leifsonia xyli TaxID=1575 RepID=UPI003D67B97C
MRIRLPKPARRRMLPLHHRVGVTLAVIGLICGFSIVPTDAALASTLRIAPSTTLAPGEAATAERASAPPQELLVDATIAAPVVNREGLSATDGLQTLARVGTNEAWAKLVLMFGGWPQTDENVNVMLRWMRQENGPPDWWNRNNPLNNGYGSGGGAGLGSYPDLVTAAEYCAKNLQRGYPDIVAGLQAGTSADATAAAIWASPWASSHYANGAHWSTRPVQIVQAPASAWGL